VNLIFIYGPPAVGKLTVAEALARETGFAMVDNHTLTNPLAHVFGWDHPERLRLGSLFRMELFRSAARANIDLITTFGGGGADYDDFIQETIKIVEEEGGKVKFVRLTASPDILTQRVAEASRSKRQKMITPEALQKKLTSTPDTMARALIGPHLEIDTTHHTPEDMARMIIKFYDLS